MYKLTKAVFSHKRKNSKFSERHAVLCLYFARFIARRKNPPTILSFLPDISIQLFLEQLVTIVTSDIAKTFEKTISPSMLSSQAWDQALL